MYRNRNFTPGRLALALALGLGLTATAEAARVSLRPALTVGEGDQAKIWEHLNTSDETEEDLVQLAELLDQQADQSNNYEEAAEKIRAAIDDWQVNGMDWTRSAWEGHLRHEEEERQRQSIPSLEKLLGEDLPVTPINSPLSSLDGQTTSTPSTSESCSSSSSATNLSPQALLFSPATTQILLASSSKNDLTGSASSSSSSLSASDSAQVRSNLDALTTTTPSKSESCSSSSSTTSPSPQSPQFSPETTRLLLSLDSPTGNALTGSSSSSSSSLSTSSFSSSQTASGFATITLTLPDETEFELLDLD